MTFRNPDEKQCIHDYMSDLNEEQMPSTDNKFSEYKVRGDF